MVRASVLLCVLLASCSVERPFGAGPKRRAVAAAPPPVPLAEVSVAAGQVRGITGVRGDLGLAVEHVSNRSLTVRWQAVPEATGYVVRLGAEPPKEDGSMSGSFRLGRVPAGGDRSFRVDNLAPDTHVFLQVFAERKDGAPPLWGVAHVHQPLPTETTRDGGDIIGVHAMARDVLAIVVRQDGLEPGESGLEGNRGKDWQAGRWEVTGASGRTLTVERVMRHSVVAGERDLEIGFGAPSKPTVNVEHRIYLRVNEPLGSTDVLHVTHRAANGAPATALDVRVPFSDKYLETPAIQVNQVGYNPRAKQRFAYVYAWLGDGGGLELSSFPNEAEVIVEPRDGLAPRQTTLAKLAVTPRETSREDVVGAVGQIDLGTLPPHEARRYRVRLPGVGVSYPTAVSERAAFKAFYTVARGLYHNRWCGELRSDLTEWSRPADHCTAYFVGGSEQGFFGDDTPRKKEKPLRGGHHDAGDFDIRPMHVLVGQALLRAFELGPSRFSDGQLALPESSNKIPDLLDEALWSLAAWEDLQNADGGVRLGVESTRHPAGYYFAHDDELPYFAYDATPAHSAYVAGLFAQAAHLVHPYDSSRSKELLARARRAYEYANANSAPDTYLAYAAGELSRASDDAAARGAYERLWSSVDRHGGGLFDHMQPAFKIYPGSIFSQHPAMPDFTLGYVTGPSPNAIIRESTRARLDRWADDASARLLQSAQPHRSGRPPHARPDWGMDSSQGRFLDGIYQRLELAARGAELVSAKRQSYFDALSVAADYMLGANPLGLSYVTGLGSRAPEQPLHSDSIAFQIARDLPPVPGLVVYGPVEGFPRAPYYRPVAQAFYPAFERQPRALRYADAAQAVNTSEFSVWETQAPTVLLFAALLGEGMRPWPELAPGEPEHRAPLPALRGE
jgi:endoglucanase